MHRHSIRYDKHTYTKTKTLTLAMRHGQAVQTFAHLLGCAEGSLSILGASERLQEESR